jgi:hypothetical protein
MMFGLKYAFHADVIAVRQCGMAPRKDAYGTTAGRRTTARGSFLYVDGCTLQRDVLMVEARAVGGKRTDADLARIGCNQTYE